MNMTHAFEYILYCRKSSDETSDLQKQSIPDQIKACVEYAKKENLTIAKKPSNFRDFESETDLYKEDNDTEITNRRIYQSTRDLFIIKEQESWKEPYKRPKWRRLVKLIDQGKIKWLLCYSPDRQARNMLEGWELINLVDEGKVDLKYTNFHFENNASGKMMLWFWFVFSKQYSDKLSEDISRWIKSKTESGKALWKPKAGYYINDEWYYQPHPEYFPIIQEAFMRKLRWETDEKITNFINASWYRRITKSRKEEKEMNVKNIYKLWIDEFYYGILIHGAYTTDLRNVEYYKPMITEEQHLVLRARYEDNTKYATKFEQIDEFKNLAPFDNKLVQTEDGSSMTFTLPNKHRFLEKITKANEVWELLTLEDVVSLSQIRYRCGNKHSKHYNIEVVAEDIDNAVTQKLKNFRVSDDEFQKYLEYWIWVIRELTESSQEKIWSVNLQINRLKSDRAKYIENNMWVKKDIEEEEIYQRKRSNFDDKIVLLKKEIEEIEKQERNELLEIEAFINVLSNADRYYKKLTNVQKRKIADLLFLNIVVDHQKRLHINVKPWLESLFTLNGAELRERFEHFRMWVKACSTDTARWVISLYISEFWWLKSALEKLSYKQKIFYQLKVKEELLDIRSYD